MTTQISYDPVPPNRHGQLMVRYPELMHGASRPDPPSWIPVAATALLLAVLGTIGATAACTILFGFIGGILLGAGGGSLGLLAAFLAASRARHAAKDRNPRHPYWLAFGVTMVVAAIPCLLAIRVTEAVVEARVVEPAATRAVQSDMVHGNRIKTVAGVTVQRATCTPVAARHTTGLRKYTCVVTLSSDQSGTLHVLADRKGRWAVVKSR